MNNDFVNEDIENQNFEDMVQKNENDNAQILKATKVATEEKSLTNCAFVNAADLDAGRVRHVEVIVGPGHGYVFTIKNDETRPGYIAFGMSQRRWAQISTDQSLKVLPYNFNAATECISNLTISVTFYKNPTTDSIDTDQMAREFLMQYPQQAFTSGQEFVFKFDNKLLRAVVKDIEAANMADALKENGHSKAIKIHKGLLLPNSVVIFDRLDNDARINLVGKSMGKLACRSIINPDWDFEKMGIGGLDKEFSAIFRRSFASRVFPPGLIEQWDMKHVRGILLYGPPGTGKTLMARQIGKMLNAREPKIINGPQILDKYVGESEANVRKLFADAEEEYKRMGANSGLHIIIFDEIDAICKQRGSVAGSTAVHDTVVNQLLSKIDGVDQLNNILVIDRRKSCLGMTNRRDMIDEALLRPGRLEVQMEISLPDEKGRLQILNIHTSKMREHKKLSSDVDLNELAKETKNFSGAEIEGLVRAAQSSAMNRLVKVGSKVEIDPDAIEKLMVCRDDFLYALENDVKPAFGFSSEQLENYIRGGILNWGEPVQHILDGGNLLIEETKASDSRGLVSVLLHGPPNSGKTALAAAISKASNFPFVKIVSPEDMIGYTENAKCLAIKKAFDDAYKSPLSLLLVDDLESLIEFSPIGPRYSNTILQALKVSLRKLPPPKKKLLVVATSSEREIMEELRLLSAFSRCLYVHPLQSGKDIVKVVEELEAFTSEQLISLHRKLGNRKCKIGIKKLLDQIDLAKQYENSAKVDLFISSMEEEGCIALS
uniref:Vesicle-fusing ATPase n=1 Tax=Romanomermis culicivorax TaxID=13658 RepID=A0A915JQC9_ROMCU